MVAVGLGHCPALPPGMGSADRSVRAEVGEGPWRWAPPWECVPERGRLQPCPPYCPSPVPPSASALAVAAVGDPGPWWSPREGAPLGISEPQCP